jgi:hypothetical protein
MLIGVNYLIVLHIIIIIACINCYNYYYLTPILHFVDSTRNFVQLC